MGLNAFDLTGKVAIVTGCDTGLGQGMAVGLAEAGCDMSASTVRSRTKPQKKSGRWAAASARFRRISAARTR
ncbi:2-dehydro-3-deoxy-D-gluconate 5-dehydrogenase [Raoultella terrigena]|uniref:2-dehydro-3-deoxy-D-gluconate 5-dehydrogenase n=1 Tax=Raoultella terrigena TaxID=577 RepID=A0A4U9CUR5_RAOTE|nr:2-dehydro-3-deoxy-D-gluconate 5-dehydrogenase [Raoultella terrigena]